MIEFKNVSKIYSQGNKEFNALKDINLTIHDGSIVGILGQSGAGKSTLLRMINGITSPTAGQILVDGVDITQLKPKALQQLRHQMGMVFQHFNLLNTKTVFDNVALALKACGQPKAHHQQQVMDMLKLVGLESKAKSFPAQLSGGQKQRVGIARALVTRPKYLLCDEMTSALDPQTSREILDLLKSLHKQYNLTIIFITHQIEAVMQLSKEVVLMHHALITHRSSTLDLFLHLDNPATAPYLKTVLYDVPIEHEHVYQLIYIGEILQERSVLSTMVRKYGVDVNIIHAKILIISEQRLGYLYVQILGKQQESVLTYLREQGILVQLIPQVTTSKESK